MDKIFLNTAFSLLLGVFTIFLLSFLGFVFNISITPIYPVFGLLLTFAAFVSNLRRENISLGKSVLCCITLAFLIIAAVAFSASLMDSSWDGRTYHQTVALFLNKGWNPIYNDVYNFSKTLYGITLGDLIWCENYVKFSEIFAANILALTGKIEAGKAFNGISCIILFCYSFYTLKRMAEKNLPAQNVQKSSNTTENPSVAKPNTLLLFVFSSILIYNPVVISQFFTYYVDGLLYLYFLTGVFALINWNLDYTNGKNPCRAILIFIMSSCITLNIKFGGLLCFVCILLCATIFWMLQKIKFTQNQQYKSLSLKIFNTKIFWYSVLVIIVLALVSGINPYFTNVSKHRNIIYPLAGANKIDVITLNTPKGFENRSSCHKFFISLFAKSANYTNVANIAPKLKLPFTIHKKEFRAIKDPDTRIAGFGILFSGILLLTIFFLFKTDYKNAPAKNEFTLIFAIIGLSVVLNPENWWARYIPQFWALVALAAYFIYLNPKNPPNQTNIAAKNSHATWILASLMILNSFLTNCASYSLAQKYTAKTKEIIYNIKSLQEADSKPFTHKMPKSEDVSMKISYFRKLDEAGVKYNIQDIQDP